MTGPYLWGDESEHDTDAAVAEAIAAFCVQGLERAELGIVTDAHGQLYAIRITAALEPLTDTVCV